MQPHDPSLGASDPTAYAHSVHWLFVGLLASSTLAALLVVYLLVSFAWRYRRRSAADRGDRIKKSWKWEVGWTLATMIAFFVFFVEGARLFVSYARSPAHALTVFVVAKQWMWKFEHRTGQREIDTLHVPVGRTIRLVLASQDVIHSFYVPAFRIKRDAVPGRYETLWFRVEVPGTYPLRCTEFCGTGHWQMAGQVIAMTPESYAAWLEAQGASHSLAAQGGALFRALGCSGCHSPGANVHAPLLEGVWGRPVPLSNGQVVMADRRYIRDSILEPEKDVAAGYRPIMPSFRGRVSEDDIIKLLAYIESLARKRPDVQ